MIAADLAPDIVELAPYLPPAESAPLREMAFRPNAWRPDEIDTLRTMFAADEPLAAIVAAIGRPLHGVRTQIWVLGLRRNSNRPWSELEDRELALRYGGEPVARLAGELGRGVPAVYARANMLGLSQPGAPDYEPWEDEQIKAGYAAGVPVGQIASLIGRPLLGVRDRAGTLGLRHPSHPADWSDAEARRMLELAETGMLYSRIRRQLIAEGFPPRSKQGFGGKLRQLGYGRGWGRAWTPDEDELLRRAYAEAASLAALALSLGRPRTSVSHRAKHLGLTGTHASPAGFRQGPVWTEAEMDRLREAYGKVPMEDLARELNRKVRAVYLKAFHMRLSADYNARFTPDEDAQIRAAFAAGGELRPLCKPLGRNIDALQRRARRLGLDARGRR